MTSAFLGDGYQPPDQGWESLDPVDGLVAATTLGHEQRCVEASAPTWTDLDEGQSKILKDDYVHWFMGDGRVVLRKAGHSVAGRKGDEIAADAAVKCYEQWPDPRKRALLKGSPQYLYRVVRNLFRDQLKTSQNRHEQCAGLPGHPSTEEGVSDLVWETGKDALVDPGWEVRIAINRLDDQKSELIFLIYWLRVSRVKAAERMGITRRQADRLYQSAIGELRVLLG